jgi:hypothetical protein
LIFESHLIGFGPGVNVQDLTLGGNLEQCPRCGGVAELPEGRFNLVGDTIEVLEATPLTRARLSQLADLLDRARRGDISEDELADEIAQEDGFDRLAALLRRATPRMRHALILLLIFVVQTIATHELEGHLWGDTATSGEVKQDLSTLTQELRDDHREVQTEIQRAMTEALAKYNSDRHPAQHTGSASRNTTP